MQKFLRTSLPIVLALLFLAPFGGRLAMADDAGNVKAVQALYDAFGKGDVAGLVAGVADDVRWDVVGRPSDCPCLGVRTGKSGVEDFFKTLGSLYDVSEFAPKDFYPSGDKVFVLGHYAETHKATKKSFESDFVHVFTYKNGKVSTFQEYSDTAKEAEANRN